MKEFATARMDNFTKVTTWCMLILAPLIILPIFWLDDSWFRFFLPLIILLSFIIAYFLRPKYFMDGEKIHIKTKFKSIEIPVRSIEGIRFDDNI